MGNTSMKNIDQPSDTQIKPVSFVFNESQIQKRVKNAVRFVIQRTFGVSKVDNIKQILRNSLL